MRRTDAFEKWILALLLCCAVLLPGCSGGETPTAPAAETPEPTEAPPVWPDAVQISELMVKNQTTLDDGTGRFPDWIELHNTGTETAELEGWFLSDRADRPRWRFPAVTLEPDAYLLIFCAKGTPAGDALCAGFGISAEETVRLFAPDGTPISEAAARETEADCSLVSAGDGTWHISQRPTPGYANTREGYLRFLEQRSGRTGLVINEVLVRNDSYLPHFLLGTSDLVELKNTGTEAVWLGDYELCDANPAHRCRLPDRTLAPGELFLVFCAADVVAADTDRFYAPFALDARRESLYLYGEDGTPADYMLLCDIPEGGSYGRMRERAGLFFFPTPTPGAENAEGKPLVSLSPQCSPEPGVYENSGPLQIELTAEKGAQIFYTTDGSLPTENATLYTGPIPLEETAVIRAVALEEDAWLSPAATCSFMLNENLHLPLLSIATDDPALFRTLYFASSRDNPMHASAEYFNGAHSFRKDCILELKGWTSLSLPKKSLGLEFKNSVDGLLEADVFGNGVTLFSDLSVRAGQDNLKTLFRTELVQDLVLESSEHLLVQASQFCVVFVNGEYWGIYALKEDLTRQYYASHYGVSPESVEVEKGEVSDQSDFYRDVIAFSVENDMADPKNYARMCETIDVDSFIDWIIFEGYSGNTDTLNNIRFFRSSEGDGLWRWALYDLDWAFYHPELDFRVIMNCEYNAGYQMYQLMMALFENPEFKAAFLRRFGELNRSVLSNAHVLENIDRYEALLEPEIARDEKLRGSSYESWAYYMEELKNFITEYDRENHNVKQLALFLNMTEEEVRAGMAG